MAGRIFRRADGTEFDPYNIGVNSRRANKEEKPQSSEPPQKAPAAPTGQTISAFTGLCDALNEYQQYLVETGLAEYPDEYVIEFNPQTVAQSSIALNRQEYKATPTAQSKTPAAQKDSATNSVDLTGRVVPVTAGTQIVQFIDQVMRSSSFITDQSNVVIDERSGAPKFKNTPDTNETISWYKINFQAIQLRKDSIRNDYAYRMIYTISPYQINQMESQFFSKSRYRGVHKSYNYWFTGKNNAVLNFDQEYNNSYYAILTGFNNGVGTGGQIPEGATNKPAAATNTANSTISYSYAPAAGVSNQGAANAANEIGASAADWLYAPIKNGFSKLRIVGDPSWIQQGELTNGINASTITFAPFLPDGTINFEGSEVMFDLYFNRPSDYNFETGLVDVNKQNTDPNGTLSAQQPQAHLTYITSQVKSYFMQGKFEQEITGNFFSEQFEINSQSYVAQREATKNNARLAREGLTEARKSVAGGNGYWDGEAPPASDATPPIATGITNPSPQPAPPAAPPTSNADIVYQATLEASLRAGDITIEQAIGIGYKPQISAPPADATGD